MMNRKPTGKQPEQKPSIPLPEVETPANLHNEQKVAVDGFRQVLEMLRIADPAFRESLLKRLAARDRELAQSLRQELGI